MGPFELMDLTGNDVGYDTTVARRAERGDPADPPSQSAADKVERDERDRQTGKGWYECDERGIRVAAAKSQAETV
jgi:3-hydroxybutyryl-CoA dehydrogenase